MAWKEVNSTAMSLTSEKGKSATGVLMGSRTVKGNYGDQKIWDFSDDDAIGFSVYGFTALDRKLSVVPTGALCKLTYQGKVPVKIKGKLKDVHQVSVQVDDSHPTQQNGKVERGANGHNRMEDVPVEAYEGGD